MALQVWLPLNGNLNNKGCSALTFSLISTNTSINTSGKIGSCYGNNSNTAGGIISNTTISLGQKQSMFCWFKFTSLPSDSSLGGGLVSQHRYSNKSGMGITIRYASSTTGYLSVNTGNGSSRTYNTYYGTTLLQANTWYHGGYTYDGSTIRIYVNGVCEKEQAYADMSVPADYVSAFCWSSNGSSGSTQYSGYKLNGYLNDVRVYDHCLSLAEIKELSKGLIVHYKLDSAYRINNLNRNSTYSVYNNFSSSGCTASITNTGRTYNTCKIYRLTYTPSSDKLSHIKTTLTSHGIMGFGRTFLANTKYCFWILCKPISHPDTIVGGVASNIAGWTEIPMKKYNDDWYVVGQCRKGNVTQDKTDSIYTSFKTPSAEAGVPITIDFCCPHVLEGYDSIQPEYDYIGTTPNIADSSGHGYHGTITGSVSANDSTPRYDISTQFASGAHIYTPTLSTGGFSNTYTFSWWGKYSNYSGHMMWGFSDGNRLNLYMSGGNFYWNTGDGSNNPFSVSAATYGDGNWHHFAVTGDGTTAKLYIDGVFKANAKTYRGITGTKIYMNGWDSGTSYNFNGQLSDFRLYGTCLSADDISRLYNVAASVSKNGAMLGYEMKEG